ncbi:MAG TPA: hypothetical protein VHZ25_17595 [Acidobacteriaceae bacterium]|jgi:hypothetical protein|nr:hypothetical protein [Acidobacteriaceae bacterium]
MNRNSGESAVDRLIALAQQKPGRPGGDASDEPMDLETVPLGMPSARELEHNPMWKALLQLRTFLPYIARFVEMSSGTQQHQQSTSLSTEVRTEMRQSVGALESSHRDLRLAVLDQTVELKRIEETMTRTREATERNALEVSELGDDVRSMRSLVKMALGILVLLFVTLIGLVIFLLFKVKPH